MIHVTHVSVVGLYQNLNAAALPFLWLTCYLSLQAAPKPPTVDAMVNTDASTLKVILDLGALPISVCDDMSIGGQASDGIF